MAEYEEWIDKCQICETEYPKKVRTDLPVPPRVSDYCPNCKKNSLRRIN